MSKRIAGFLTSVKKNHQNTQGKLFKEIERKERIKALQAVIAREEERERLEQQKKDKKEAAIQQDLKIKNEDALLRNQKKSKEVALDQVHLDKAKENSAGGQPGEYNQILL